MNPQSSYVTLTDDTFATEVLESSIPVLVDVWAPWCGPCRVIGPVVEQIAQDFNGRAKVGKLNIDDHPRLATRYGVRAVPTLLIFQNGRVVDEIIGVVPKSVLAEKLNALVQQLNTVA